MTAPGDAGAAKETGAAKGTGTPRRSRWRAAPRPVLLNAHDRALLAAVAAHQPVTLPQLARLVGRAYKDAQRTARRLLDAQLVARFPGPAGASMSPQNAPAVHGLTAAGAGLAGEARYRPPAPWRLEHELGVRDVVAWACGAARAADLAVPAVSYEPRVPGGLVPDALLSLSAGGRVMTALVEYDRGTEAAERWRAKAAGYARLFAAGDLTALVGRPSARLLVVCPDQVRCAWADARLREAGVAAWFAPAGQLAADAFGEWRVSGGGQRPFLPPSLLSPPLPLTSLQASDGAAAGRTPVSDG